MMQVMRKRLTRMGISGAALAEMGMLVALISVLAIGGVYSLGAETEDTFCSASAALNKAKGGDEACLNGLPGQGNSMAVAGDGFDHGDFVSVIWPKAESGERDIFLPFETGTAQPFDMVVTASSGDVQACYALDPTGVPECSVAGSAARISVPEGARRVGYRVMLPENPATLFDRDFDLAFEVAGVASQSWSINQFRPAEGPAFETNMEFANVDFPMGTTGQQWVMVPKTGTFGAPMSLSVSPAGSLKFGACVQATSGAGLDCQPLVNSESSADVAPEDYALGYSLTLPADTTVDVVEGVQIDLTTPGYPMNFKSWTIAVTRPENPTAVGLGLSFADVVMNEGETQRTVMATPTGVADSSYVLNASTASGATVEACYKVQGSTVATCAASLQVENPSAITEVGFRIAVDAAATVWEDFNGVVSLTATLEADPSITESWDVAVRRPAKPITFEPQATFTDVVLDAGDETSVKTVYASLDASGMNTGWTMSTDGNGAISAIPCIYKSNSTSNFCAPTYTTGRSDEYYVPSVAKIGFRMQASSLGDVTADFSGPLDVILTSDQDPTVSKTFTVNVSRPAYVPPPDIFAPEVTFHDFDFAANYADWADYPFDLGGTINKPAMIEVSHSGNSIRTGYWVDGKYGGLFSEPAVYGPFPTDTKQVGVRLDLRPTPAGTAIDETVTVKIYAQDDPSQFRTWSFQVRRPAS